MRLFKQVRFTAAIKLLCIFYLTVLHQQEINAQKDPASGKYATRMWYTNPSVNWNEALPVGNGRLGGMVFGGARYERVALNEQTLWSGAPRDGNNPEAKKYLPLVRSAALAGRYREADSLSKFMQGPWTESYMPMADLLLGFSGISDTTGYIRELSLDSAITRVSFGSADKRYTREIFASFPDQVIVIRQFGTRPGSINVKASLTSKLHHTIQTIRNNHLVLKGKCPMHVEPAYLWRLSSEQALQYAENENGEGMNFQVHLLTQVSGGKITSGKSDITIESADTVTFYISAATSYNGYNKSPGLEGKDPAVEALQFLQAAIRRPFHELKQRHINDYQPIFNRVEYYLGESRNKNLPTTQRLREMRSYADPELVAQIAQFGRYLLIAGSRPGGQPVNLKGIWNERLRPEYSSNWCIDHDAQMFYYAVESANLSEMHLPFLQFIDDLSKNGAKTAKINYGMRGWCAHHNTDIWRCSNPVGNYGEGNPHWATWNMSGPWLSAHFFEHYLFTGDREFLKNTAWPVMKGAAEFCLDWLLEQNGKLISVPSVSPENTFITNEGDTAQISVNSTSDIALIKQLFRNCIKAAEILQQDSSFAHQLKRSFKKLPSYKTGSKGQLLEWEKEWRAVDPAHRHLSHLYPVFPGDEISDVTTPSLGDAAKRALSLREKTNCSWGFAWKAACWARLHEGDSAWQTWQSQLQYVDARSTSSLNNYGLFPNLFNSDGRDLIMNGNGCATAVLTEMMLQSHTGTLELLPALPAAFEDGYVKGLCARGGFEVDIRWKKRKMTDATIYSKLGNDCTIMAGQNIKVFMEGRAVRVSVTSSRTYVFKTEAGKRYRIQRL